MLNCVHYKKNEKKQVPTESLVNLAPNDTWCK